MKPNIVGQDTLERAIKLIRTLAPAGPCYAFLTVDRWFVADIHIRSKLHALPAFAGLDSGIACRKIYTGIAVFAHRKNLFSWYYLIRNKDSFFTHFLSLLSF
jgi:hypothetical protein